MTETDYREAIDKARAAYEKAVATQPAAKVAPLAEEVKRLTTELAASLSKGAKKCKACGDKPIGMLRRPGYVKNGMPVAPIYEVACLACPHWRGYGNTPKEAVAMWNKLNQGEQVNHG